MFSLKQFVLSYLRQTSRHDINDCIVVENIQNVQLGIPCTQLFRKTDRCRGFGWLRQVHPNLSREALA